MNKYIGSILIGSLFLMFLLSSNVMFAEEEVSFKDEKLESIVRSYISKDDDSPIYQDDLNSIKRLILKNSGVKDLTGIGYLKNLEYIYLEKCNDIETYEPLADLDNITWLNFKSTNIGDFSFIENITTLEKLTVTHCTDENLSTLPYVPSLKSLMVSAVYKTDITTIEFLENLPGLESIKVDKGEISDLSPLRYTEGVSSVHFPSHNISDIDILSDLRSISYLDLSENSLTDIEPLKSHPELVSLNVQGNDIESLEPIADFDNLKKLNISDNSKMDLSGLDSLSSMEELEANRIGLEDLEFLEDMKALTHLSLSGNNLTDIEPISYLSNLKKIYLSDNYITDISDLERLDLVTSLYLTSNYIEDIRSLESMEGLYTVWIAANPYDQNEHSMTVVETLRAEGKKVYDDTIASVSGGRTYEEKAKGVEKYLSDMFEDDVTEATSESESDHEADEGITSLAITKPSSEDTQSDFYTYTEAMAEYGLAKGNDNGYELNRQPTRLESLVMILRLKGVEAEAAAFDTSSMPFKDVPDWGGPYVSYAYSNGITSGISEEVFGSNNVVTDKEFHTFILRSLGYDNTDFAWNQSTDFMMANGMISDTYYEHLQSNVYKRAEMFKSAYIALMTPLKGQSTVLAKTISLADTNSSFPDEFLGEDYMEAEKVYPLVRTYKYMDDDYIIFSPYNEKEYFNSSGNMNVVKKVDGVAYEAGELGDVFKMSYYEAAPRDIEYLLYDDSGKLVAYYMVEDFMVYHDVEALSLGGMSDKYLEAKSLYVYGGARRLEDISSLPKFQNLEYLYLYTDDAEGMLGELYDIEGIGRIENLKMCYVCHMYMGGYTSVYTELENLEFVNLSQNADDYIDMSAFQKSRSTIKGLNITNQKVDLAALSEFESLEYLDLELNYNNYGNVQDSSVLSNLDNVRYLKLESGEYSGSERPSSEEYQKRSENNDLSFITGMDSLEVLELNYVYYVDYESINQCHSLEKVIFDGVYDVKESGVGELIDSRIEVIYE